ncbi:MAG: SH3 domain-containing protein [Lachnospiraceae bacterium]|nr:SH3 domain-containing protein [Lachnospiraceae bacterium]
MKCPNCSAETDKRVCPYCGTEIPNAGRVKCPNCGSRNTTFKRELVRSNNRSTSVRITKNVRTRGGGSTKTYRTVGLCKDCGNTWIPDNGKSKTKPWWFWVLAIAFWPIALSIWFWKTNKINMPNKTKGIVLGAVWGVFLLFPILAGGAALNEDTSKKQPSAIEDIVTENETSDKPETATNEIDRSIPEAEESETEPEKNNEEKASDISVAYATDVLNIREQPNTDCSILGKTELGEQVTILDTEGDWSHVMTNGLDGYIKSEYLSNEPIESSAADTTSNAGGNENTTTIDANTETSSNTGNPDAFADYVATGAPSGKIVVNATNGKVHNSDCSRLPEEDNRIYFDSLQEALDHGYTDKCGICMK